MLTQAEADMLIGMLKRFEAPTSLSVQPGDDLTFELVGDDPRERFLLDVWRGTYRLTKIKHQTRGRKAIVLVRLDIDGGPHTNPDGVKMGGTHLHIYREGFEDRWAFPLAPRDFPAPMDVARTIGDFCQYCNIEQVPAIQGELL